MNYIKIKIETNKDGIEIISEIFENFGITGLEIEDCEEFLAVLEETRKQWDFVEDELYNEKSKACSVSAYLQDSLSDKEILSNIIKKIEEINNIGNIKAQIYLAEVREEDWAENWKKYFKPILIGERILICPAWEEVPEEYKLRVVFKIDPGMSFGTGTHETTRLCVASLEKYVNEKSNVLDLGCGSGILSIISVLLGANNAIAVDIDENSVRIAKENALANNIETQKYNVYSGNLLSDKKLREIITNKGKFNLILMNIIPDVIIPLIPFVKSLLDENGVCILSGIIERYAESVKIACENCGLRVVDCIKENDWVCFVAKL